MSDLDQITPGRVSPRECVRAARDALTKAYGAGGGQELWPFYLEAVDWLRRAAEQLAGSGSGSAS